MLIETSMLGRGTTYSRKTPNLPTAKRFSGNTLNIGGTSVACVREYQVIFLNTCILNSPSQLYASGSSLTTRRRHLGKEHVQRYLELIQTRQLPNKLPEFLRKQREEDHARDIQRTPFSIKAFQDKLVSVIVSNDLVSCTLPIRSTLMYRQSINLIENHEFRDLLLLLRESLQDGDIPRRTKLQSLILDAWLKYYKSLKKELKVSASEIQIP